MPQVRENADVPIDQVHHVRLPVADLERSLRWYSELLQFETDFSFMREGRVIGWALRHRTGAVNLVLIQDAEAARCAAGFPYFSFTLSDEAGLRALAHTLDQRGVRHGPIEPALAGFKLLDVCDPDGHRIGFYMAGPRQRNPGTS